MSERWLRLLIVAGVLGVILRAPALTLVVSIMLALIALSLMLRTLAFRRVSYSRRISETRGFVGETLRITTRTENAGYLPIFSLSVQDDSPKHFDEIEPGQPERDAAIIPTTPAATRPERADLQQLTAIRPRSINTNTFDLRSHRRGYFNFPTPVLRAIDLVGMGEEERAEPQPVHNTILIYPKLYLLDELKLPEKQPMGALVSLRRLIEDPARNMGARDYAPGDSFRQIHWPATAHRGSLQTRINEHTADPVTMILLNVTTFEDDWIGVDVERFEWTVSVAGSLARWAHESGATIGLVSNGATPGIPEALRVRARRSPDQLARVLESLATLIAFTGSRYEEFVLTEQRNVPFGSSLILVTGLVTPRIEIAIHRLHELGKRMLLVCCDRSMPDLSGLPCAAIHLPPTLAGEALA